MIGLLRCAITKFKSDRDITMTTVIETQMLIRRSVNIVFNAFVDPLITTKFWFSQSSGYLEKGAIVDWTWDKYQITHSTHVLQVVENELICIEWGTPKTKVDFVFEKIDSMNTYVIIRNYDIELQGNELIHYVMDATGGFTTVLDGAKAWLEYDIQLNLVEDKFPPFQLRSHQ